MPEGIAKRPLNDGSEVYDVNVRLGSGHMFRRRGFKTLREAVAARDKARDDARAGRAVEDHRLLKVTVADLAHGWLEAHRSEWSPASRYRYEADWRALSVTFGGCLLVRLTSTDVGDWLTDHTARYAPDTVAGRIQVLRAILDRGADSYGVANVARLVKRRRSVKARAKAKRRALTRTEAGALLEAMEPRYRVMVHLCLGLGLRSGEARGLTYDRVDSATGAVVIDRQLKRRRVGEPWVAPEVRLTNTEGLGHVKTPNSDATVWAGADVLEALAWHRETFGENRYGLVVTNRANRPCADAAWSTAVRRAAVAAGVAVVGHELRHTAGQWVYEATKSLEAVAAFLRDDVHTVTKVYLHRGGHGPELSEAVMGSIAGAARTARARGHLRAVQ
jgi:integrase